MYDVSVYISEAEVAAFVAESELFVVHTEEVEDGRVKVVHVDLVLDCGCVCCSNLNRIDLCIHRNLRSLIF